MALEAVEMVCVQLKGFTGQKKLTGYAILKIGYLDVLKCTIFFPDTFTNRMRPVSSDTAEVKHAVCAVNKKEVPSYRSLSIERCAVSNRPDENNYDVKHVTIVINWKSPKPRPRQRRADQRTHQLDRDHRHRLQRELAVAQVEEVLEARTQQLEDERVVLAARTKVVDLGDTLCKRERGDTMMMMTSRGTPSVRERGDTMMMMMMISRETPSVRERRHDDDDILGDALCKRERRHDGDNIMGDILCKRERRHDGEDIMGDVLCKREETR